MHYITASCTFDWYDLSDDLQDRHLASRLLQYLMEQAHCDNRSVFRNNLEIIKTLVECWKDNLQAPTKLVVQMRNWIIFYILSLSPPLSHLLSLSLSLSFSPSLPLSPSPYIKGLSSVSLLSLEQRRLKPTELVYSC
jgi:hypothetical protein